MPAIDIRKPLKKFLPFLLAAREENLNESGTAQRLVKFFEDVLGYDPLADITRELEINEKYCDVAIKLDGRIKLLLEAKAAATVLRDRHIEQAERYAAEGNLRWVILTNGVQWNLYHLTFDEGIEYERAFSVDVSTDPLEKVAECLALLHKRSIEQGLHERYWERCCALGPESIGKAIFTEEVLRLIRREIRHRQGALIDPEDLATAIHNCFSQEVRDKMGPVKISRRRRKVGKKDMSIAAQGTAAAPSLITIPLGAPATPDPAPA